MIESGVFKIGHGRFARILFSLYGQPWIIGGCVLLLTALFLGVAIDYRILIMVVIVLCLVFPGVLLILYYNYGLKGRSYMNVVDHTVTVEPGVLVVKIRIKNADDPEDSLDEASEGTRDKGEEEWRIYRFEDALSSEYSVGSEYVVFHFTTPEEGFLCLDAEAFGDKENFAKVVEMISKRKNENNKG